MDGELRKRAEAAAETFEIPIGDWPLVEAVLALFTERRDWTSLARAYRSILVRLAAAKEPDEREPAMWRALAEVYRDRLGRDELAIDTFRHLTRVAPSSLEAKHDLAALYAKAQKTDEALAVYEEILRQAPLDKAAYERIFELRAQAGDVDAAWCAASALVLLGDAEERATDFHADYAPKRLPALGVLDVEHWAKLRHADEDPYLTGVFASIAATLPVTRKVPTIAAALLATAKAAFGVKTDFATLPAGAALDAPLLFEAGREAACLRTQVYTLGSNNVSTLQSLFFASVKRVTPGFKEPEAFLDSVDICSTLLERVLQPVQVDALRIAVPRFLEQGNRLDAARWRHAVELTRIRAGLLFAGDPAAARTILDHGDDALTAEQKIGDAAAFVASRTFVELRAVLGWGVRATTDAIPAPSKLESDDELRTRAGRMTCETCAKELEVRRFDVFRSGTRAVLAGKCQACGTARSVTLTVAPGGPPPAPPAPPPEKKNYDALVAAVIPSPPATVGALLDALSIRLDKRDFAVSVGRGEVVLASRHLTARYVDDAPMTSIDALRERRLTAFAVVIPDRDAVRAALEERFAAGPTLAGAKGDDYATYGPWVFTARSCVLGWFAELPAWLRTPPDPAARQKALDALVAGLREGRALDAIALDPAGGITRTGPHTVAFVPPIPSKVLERALVDPMIVPVDDEDAWVLRRLPRRDEPGPSVPITIGSTVVVPLLAGRPGGGFFGDSPIVHFGHPLDVVTAMRIEAPASAAPSRHRMLARKLLDAPPRTVGELALALGVSLDGATVDGATLRTVNLTATLGDGSALASRPVLTWTATFEEGITEIDAELVERFGAREMVRGEYVYDTWRLVRAPKHGTGTLSRAPLPATEWLTWVAARPDGELVAVGDDVGRLRVWSPVTGKVTVHHLGDRIRSAMWTYDGAHLLVVAAGSEEIHVYSADGARCERRIPTRHSPPITGLAVHPKKPWAATVGFNGSVRIWDVTTGAMVMELEGGSEQGSAVALSATHVAAGWRSGSFTAWELETKKDVAGGELFGKYVAAMAFSPDGTSLVCGGGGGSMLELRTSTWQAGSVWKQTPPKPIATNAIAFAPNQKNGRFVCAHSDDTASFFKNRTQTLERALGRPFHHDRKPWEQAYIVSGACFVPKRSLILTSHFTGRLRVWKEDGLITPKLGEIAFDDTGARVVEGTGTPASWWGEPEEPKPAPPSAPPPPDKADIVRIGDAEHQPRTVLEMELAASLRPCATCGGTIGDTERLNGVLTGACPFCGRARSFVFHVDDHDLPYDAEDDHAVGGPEPSRILTADELRAELARLTPTIGSNPRALAPAEWKKQNEALSRAITCAVELAKFPGEPTAERDRLLLLSARFTADVARIWELGGSEGDEVRTMLYQAYPGLPTVAELRAYLESRKVKSVRVAGPALERPEWAATVVGPADVFVELASSNTIGIHLWDDPRGRGAQAELVMSRCTLTSLKSALFRMWSEPLDGKAEGPIVVKPVVNGHAVRLVIIHKGDDVSRVLVGFDREPPPLPAVGEVIEKLVAKPPETVGELEGALGVTLDTRVVAASVDDAVRGRTTEGLGRFTLTGTGLVTSLAVKYGWSPFSENPVTSLDDLRKRRLEEWTATFAATRLEVDAVLRQRVGAPRELPAHSVYDTWILGKGEVCTLARHAKLPDWAVAAPAGANRDRALLQLAYACAAARDLAGLAHAARSLPRDAGIVYRPEYDGRSSVAIELVPSMDALALARLLGWPNTVGQAFDRNLTDWHVRIVTGQNAYGPIAIQPMLGPWPVYAGLDARPKGGMIAPGGSLGGTHAFAQGDGVRWLRIGHPG